MPYIELTQGKKALVDKELVDFLNMYSWQFNNGYAKMTRRVSGTKKKYTVYMHRVIMPCPSDLEIDHMNGDKLDNRLENLRVVTRKQNSRNSVSNRGASKYKGVWYRNDPKRKRKWCAEITVDGKKISLGNHQTEELAAKAYDEAAIKHFGEYANTNF